MLRAAEANVRTDSIGDAIGDWLVRAMGAGIVLAVLVRLLGEAGATWERAPWAVLLVVAFWIGVLVLIARPAPAAGPAPR